MKKFTAVILLLLLSVTLMLPVFAADYAENPDYSPYTPEEIIEYYGEEIAKGFSEGQYYFVGEDLYDLYGNLIPRGAFFVEPAPPTGVSDSDGALNTALGVSAFALTLVFVTAGAFVLVKRRAK